MALLNDVADRMAERTLRLIEQTGDEDLEKKVAGEIGASSPTLQEAFTTSLRILKAEARAKRYIEKLESDAGVEPAVTEAPVASEAEVVTEPVAPEAKEAEEPATAAPEEEPVPDPEPKAAVEKRKVLPAPKKKTTSAANPKALPDLGVTAKPETMDVAEDLDDFGFDDGEELIALPGPVEGRGSLS